MILNELLLNEKTVNRKKEKNIYYLHFPKNKKGEKE